MTTASLTIDARAAVGVAGPVPVTVRLTDLNGDDVERAFITATGGPIVVPSSTRCAADGTLTLAMTPQSEITPETTAFVSTYYTVRVASTDFLITKGSSTESLMDCIVLDALPLGPITGSAATVEVGTTTTGAPGSSAAVTNSGSSTAAVLDFTVPAGAAATVAVGTTTTGSAGSSASVTNSGSSSAATLNFTIPRGDAGVAGNTVLNGTGAPSGGTGANGDFYLDTAATRLYGPKTAGAWGSGTSLLGTSGTDGKTVRNGSGAPSGGLGVDGDFYINTAANTIYGPKASGSWGSPTSLVGATGASGASLLPVEMQVVSIPTIVTAVNQLGGRAFRVPVELNGYVISAPAGCVFTASTSGLPTFQLHKKPNGGAEVNVLSTALTIDANELDSSTAATPAVVNGTNATVATADLLYWECTTTGTGTKGANLKFLLTAP